MFERFNSSRRVPFAKGKAPSTLSPIFRLLLPLVGASVAVVVTADKLPSK